MKCYPKWHSSFKLSKVYFILNTRMTNPIIYIFKDPSSPKATWRKLEAHMVYDPFFFSSERPKYLYEVQKEGF